MSSSETKFTERQLSVLREKAYAMLEERRVAHVAGCEKTAIELAERWGAEPSAAAAAAILHDVTKKLEFHEQLQLLEKYDIVPDNDLLAAPKLLHALSGAVVAKEQFHMPEEIVSAIRWHTSGRTGMTLLDKIIYLADYIEPTRDFEGVNKLREKAYQSLDDALVLGLEMSLSEVKKNGSVPHHDTVDALQYYMRGNKMLSSAEIA